MDWVSSLAERVTPAASTIPLEGRPLVLTVLLAAVAIVVDPLWRLLRIGITLVHELGHAVVGVLFGRRFTGFVVRGDMSGHAVTVGPARGFGRIATTWAGYPMPALLGAAMIVLAELGWGAPLLTGALAVLVLALTRIRSALTLLVMIAALAAVGSLWWWRDDSLQAHLLVATGIVLIVGAWRHLAALIGPGRRDRTSDPAVLAELTGVPRVLWVLGFALVMGAATASAWRTLAAGLLA
ncbi:MAG: M50 family metallopeptidase [Dermatophilaceae bacterium]